MQVKRWVFIVRAWTVLFVKFKVYCLYFDCLEQPIGSWRNVGVDQRLTCVHKSLNSELSGQQVAGIGTGLRRDWNFLGGSRVVIRPQFETFIRRQKASGIQASCKLTCYFYFLYLTSIM